MLWLLIFAPVALVLDMIPDVPAPFVFFSAALSIVPIAKLIVEGTENLAAYTGPTVGGLLNATFGNLPELIISIAAMRAGLMEMVRASLIGALLANLLLAMGIAFLLGGRRQHVQEYNPAAARTYGSIMLLAALSMVGPASFHRFFSQVEPRHAAALDTGVALVLLVLYALYLVFMLRTHPDFFRVLKGEDEGHGPSWSVGRASGTLVAASLGAAWMSEVLVGAADGTGQALGMSSVFIGIVFLAVVGGAAESGSAIAMGAKNKPDLSISIALGSSIQIALFIAPVLVFASYFIAPMPLELSFSRAEVGTLFIGVLIGAMVYGDGQANWFKGVQLITIYLIIAMMFYFMPGVA